MELIPLYRAVAEYKVLKVCINYVYTYLSLAELISRLR